MSYADLLIKSNAIFTGVTDEVISGGVAIKGNRILAVGSDNEIDPLICKDTKVYNFGDGLIMPGFNDSHIHMPDASVFGDKDFCIELSACQSEEECVSLVEEFIAGHPDNEWIFGRGWNHWIWDKPVMPSGAASLDRIATDRPICLIAWDFHTAWVNKNALRICGIDKNTPNPEGGKIEKDINGEPNGLLSEAGAVQLVNAHALRLPEKKLKASFSDFLGYAASLGFTSVGDVFPRGVAADNAFKLYKELDEEGNINVRIHFFDELKSDLNNAKELRKQNNSEKVRFCGLKLLVDGVAEAHTACLLEPYSDDPSTRGAILVDEELLKEMIVNADKEGFSVRLHTIGDAAVRLCLDFFEAAQKENGKKGLRHALEHIENIQPEDIKRLSQLGIIASMQPLHFTSNVDGYPVLVGEERVKRAWAVKSILNSGARYSFGSDVPIVEMDPILGIYTAVTRMTRDGYPAGGFNPSEKLSMAETLRGYTSGAAYVESFEDDAGTLEVGKLADIVVLSKNLFAVPDAQILDTKVLLTVMDGKITFKAYIICD